MDAKLQAVVQTMRSRFNSRERIFFSGACSIMMSRLLSCLLVIVCSPLGNSAFAVEHDIDDACSGFRFNDLDEPKFRRAVVQGDPNVDRCILEDIATNGASSFFRVGMAFEAIDPEKSLEFLLRGALLGDHAASTFAAGAIERGAKLSEPARSLVAAIMLDRLGDRCNYSGLFELGSLARGSKDGAIIAAAIARAKYAAQQSENANAKRKYLELQMDLETQGRHVLLVEERVSALSRARVGLGCER